MIRHIGMLVMMVAMGIGMMGCGTTNRNVKLYEGHQITGDTRIEVPLAKNATGQTFTEIDVEKSLTEEMKRALAGEGIWADNTYTGNYLLLPCQIMDYSPGSAFKRWLMPGYGSTVLNVKCELHESGTDNVVGVAEARHTVDAGGGYTIGAWEYIFGKLSKDLAKEIKRMIQFPVYSSADEKGAAFVTISYFQGVWVGNWQNESNQDVVIAVGRRNSDGTFDTEYSWGMRQVSGGLPIPSGTLKAKGHEEGNKFVFEFNNPNDFKINSIDMTKYEDGKVKIQMGGVLYNPVGYLTRK
jgi:hypothetical protein